jgi:hypothetical protein
MMAMDDRDSSKRPSRGMYSLVAAVLLVSIFGLTAAVPWFEEEVFGSHRVARFYHDTGIDAPFTWLANNFERLFWR